jgi:aspartyl/asparaginyl-tRNA synthetase
MQKKELSYEFLRENAHLRARTRLFAAVLRVRDAAQYGLLHFFKARRTQSARVGRPTLLTAWVRAELGIPAGGHPHSDHQRL